MLTEKEAILLKHLRQNSRKSLTEISKETNIPVSTLFDTLKKLESKAILKHVSILDFLKIGFGLKINFAIKSKQKQKLMDFLIKDKNVNSLSSLAEDYDLYAECIFKDLKDVIEFKEGLEQFEIDNIDEIFIIDEIKKEGFGL